jgi:hydrogenase maturation protein HypF
MTGLVRYRAVIEGIVQGVGFRPYLFRLAQEHHLAGEVANEGRGVVLELEGPADAVEAFFADLIPRKPPLAHIVRVTRQQTTPRQQGDFKILPSQDGPRATALIPPDVAICPDCLAELFDPQDRRYGYPFINCTNCGPRYTIIQGLPYDRPFTTMSAFPMCAQCRAEYEDPADRRFHAQPNACPACGPRVWFSDARGQEIAGEALATAGQELLQGRIVAVKGLGGFHLAVDATNPDAVERLRRRKRREEKPLALMVPDLETARSLVSLSKADEELLLSPVRPILLAPRRPGAGVAEAVAPGLDTLGVMVAYTPLHHLLLKEGPKILVMTSGNLSDEPMAMDNQEALQRLAEVADFFLLHDREIHTRADDSVAMNILDQPRVVRRSRGYVPRPVFLEKSGPEILALGPELKNTLCLTRGHEAFVSAHVGDLKDAETLAYYEQTLERLLDLVGVRPQALAVDMHPDYLSTRLAEKFPDLPLVRVQHHLAHILSAMAELGLEGPVVGLALDGTGYGLDGSVWGGEVLWVGQQGFRRMGTISGFPLPGGDKAAKQPWRTALGLLWQAWGEKWPQYLPQGLKDYLSVRNKGSSTLETLGRMMERGINSPVCHSLGRLFDGAAALAGLRFEVAYEGQAAVELEGVLDPREQGAYDLEVAWAEPNQADFDIIRIDPTPMTRALLADVAAGLDPAVLSARFHGGIAQALVRAALMAAERTHTAQAVLSGGCFMNRFLLTEVTRGLQAKGLAVHSHRDLPTNDGGISLGQALGARLALAAGRLDMWAAETKPPQGAG